MKIKEIAFYETLNLRHEILRPNLSLAMCCYPGDKDLSTSHFGGFLDDSLVGIVSCLLYTSPSPRDKRQSRMPSSA